MRGSLILIWGEGRVGPGIKLEQGACAFASGFSEVASEVADGFFWSFCIFLVSSPSPPAPNPSQHQSLFQHHSSKESILQCSTYLMIQLSHPYMTTGKSIALTRWTFVGKIMSLLFNMLSRLVITFLPRSMLMHWRRKWQPTPVFLPGKSHGWRSLAGCSP